MVSKLFIPLTSFVLILGFLWFLIESVAIDKRSTDGKSGTEIAASTLSIGRDCATQFIKNDHESKFHISSTYEIEVPFQTFVKSSEGYVFNEKYTYCSLVISSKWTGRDDKEKEIFFKTSTEGDGFYIVISKDTYVSSNQ